MLGEDGCDFWGLGPASSSTCGTEQKDCGLRHEAATVGNDSSIQSQEVGGRVLGTGARRAPRAVLRPTIEWASCLTGRGSHVGSVFPLVSVYFLCLK